MMTFLVSLVLAAAPEIFSTSSLEFIEQTLETLGPDALVLFDVDSTLIVPDNAILRPANEDFLEELLGGNFIQTSASGRRYLFREILLQAAHSLVDPGSVACIQRLQERGVPVLAFTGAPSGKVGAVASVADWRIEELRRFGFDFSGMFADKGVIELPKSPDQEFSPLFKSGILFSSLHPKGTVLQEFLHAIGWAPQRVVLVDDELEYVQSVGRALEALGISYTGFHYTAARELPCSLEREVAQFQVRFFLEQAQWIDDLSVTIQSHSEVTYNQPFQD